jgi:hypothetical protein
MRRHEIAPTRRTTTFRAGDLLKTGEPKLSLHRSDKRRYSYIELHSQQKVV